MTTPEAILLSGLTGAGLFGATRMLHNTLDSADKRMAPNDMHGVTSDKITIKLPKRQESGADINKQASEDAWKIPMSLAALAASFYGANKLHDKYQSGKAQKELDATHAKYQEMLQQQQNTKVASSTPVVDAFCMKLAEVMEKDANILSDIATGDWAGKTPGGHHMFDRQEGMGVPGGEWAADKVIWPAAGVLGSYGALKFLADRTKNKREEDAAARAKLPTQIVIDQS